MRTALFVAMICALGACGSERRLQVIVDSSGVPSVTNFHIYLGKNDPTRHSVNLANVPGFSPQRPSLRVGDGYLLDSETARDVDKITAGDPFTWTYIWNDDSIEKLAIIVVGFDGNEPVAFSEVEDVTVEDGTVREQLMTLVPSAPLQTNVSYTDATEPASVIVWGPDAGADTCVEVHVPASASGAPKNTFIYVSDLDEDCDGHSTQTGDKECSPQVYDSQHGSRKLEDIACSTTALASPNGQPVETCLLRTKGCIDGVGVTSADPLCAIGNYFCAPHDLCAMCPAGKPVCDLPTTAELDCELPTYLELDATEPAPCEIAGLILDVDPPGPAVCPDDVAPKLYSDATGWTDSIKLGNVTLTLSPNGPGCYADVAMTIDTSALADTTTSFRGLFGQPFSSDDPDLAGAIVPVKLHYSATALQGVVACPSRDYKLRCDTTKIRDLPDVAACAQP